MSSKKYKIGSYINPNWFIVAILETKNQNKKILCYNPNIGIFKEGWIWDFTRGLVNNNPNRKPLCIICNTQLNEEKDVFDINSNYALLLTIHKNISEEILISLRNIREGLVCEEGTKVLNYFNMLLQEIKNKKNKKLAVLIHSTYKILLYRGYFDNKN